MINILIHGLGQNETSWNEVEKELLIKEIKVEKPNLYAMMKIKNSIMIPYINNLWITVMALMRN
ncbi:hypothetical protein WKT02_11430 [Erysipelotrichaceae bacterium HCN-30851]